FTDEFVDLTSANSDRPYAGKGGVRIISFADLLKQFCIDVLGLSREQCYGSDHDKNTLTSIRWDNMPIGVRWRYRPRWWWPSLRSGRMTAREVMQVMGTDVVRSIYGDAWAYAGYSMAASCPESLVIISDGR